jgi:pyrroloquinoline quinone biosynthesis protein D
MKIFRNEEVLWREEDESKTQAYEGLSKGEDVEGIGTSVLFSDGLMLSLNVLGTEIWKRCDGRTLDDILAELLVLFDVGPEVLKKDALEFLSELKEKGFVRYEECNIS